ncbi:transcriptional regulator CynR [Hafnia alvei]|uniref:transcriptional regulator CynR n=1 Tax=Hafnia alvei TaxID=569 RepID=UPI001033AE23|nr:transcriptional regulator CynR [Hafnia alvei]TBL82143.1 transcriptional regulator CynR [Hafnia alvei]WNN54421.1 transcriptional regulator CynR [Hafnia alvei]
MFLRNLRALLSVVKHRNFTRASEEVCLSQPALSQKIKQLEEQLGVALLDRSHRIVRPTDVGEVYLEHARRALNELEMGYRAIHDVQDLSRGSLRVGFTPTFSAYLIGPLFKRFYQLYPNIQLHLRELSQEQLEKDLQENELDLGLAFVSHNAEHIDYHPLFSEALAVAVGENSPLYSKEKMTLDEISAVPMALLSQDFATRAYIDSYFDQHQLKPHLAIEANSISTILDLVKSSELVSVLPQAIIEKQREMHAISLVPSLPERTAALLLHKTHYISAASHAFKSLMIDEFMQDGIDSK